ncbi:MAG TPA: DUF1707 and FHA domain-containing protein [Nocardioidaceae bacterium]|nr:DUF1707 and FHA domain-containing protein [Nocardioidaceae bacterium]
MSGVSPVRASDNDRDHVVRALRDAVVAGRLSHESFVWRVDQALHARDQQTLGELVADLAPATRPRGSGTRSRLAARVLGRRLTMIGRSHPRLTLPNARRPVLVIGRRPNCDVVLRDQRVSRVHAVLMMLDDQWFLEDLRSTNGTFVNGNRLRVATMLREGDRVSFGGLTLRFDRPPSEGRP